MEAIIAKLACRVPALCARALAGDPIAIAEITALAVACGYKIIKES